jgi:hypothetical protein
MEHSSAQRTYPVCCQSMYCGRTQCFGCPNEEKLKTFKAWVAQTKAVQADPIWAPTIYKARP